MTILLLFGFIVFWVGFTSGYFANKNDQVNERTKAFQRGYNKAYRRYANDYNSDTK